MTDFGSRFRPRACALLAVAALAALVVPARSLAQAPTFNALVTTYTNSSYNFPGYAAVGDFNGDGKLDALVSDGSASLRLMLGNGDGTFTEHDVSVPGTNPGMIRAADLNGDGKLDAVTVSNGGNSAVTVLLNTGNDGNGVPQFTVTNYNLLQGVRSVTIGDLNGDGKPDLVVGNCCGSVAVMLNTGGGTFNAPPGSYSLQPGAGGPSVGPGVIVDVNGDGKADYVVASNQNHATNVFFGNGDGTLQAPVVIPSYGLFLAVVDVNHDGKPDLVEADPGSGDPSSGKLMVFLNSGDGKFSAPPTLYATGLNQPFSLTTADLDGDGNLDVVLSDFNGGSGHQVAVLLGDGQGQFGAPNLYAVNQGPLDVAVGDFNGDGRLDIATVGRQDRTYGVLLNKSKPTASAALGNLNQVYDGTPKSVTVTTTPAGLATSVTYNGSAALPVAAGSYAVQATITGNNYIAQPALGTLVIAKATPQVSAPVYLSISYGTPSTVIAGRVGLATVAATGTVTVVLNGVSQNANLAADGTYAAAFNTGTLGVATYPVNILYNGDSNFVAGTGAASLTVTPAPLLIAANDTTKVLHAPNPAFTASFTGFVLGQGPSVLAGTLTCSSSAVTGSAVGSYPISCSGLSSTNYAVSYAGGTLKVLYSTGYCGHDEGEGEQNPQQLSHAMLKPIAADGSSVFELGRAVPVKFRLCDANGAPVATPSAVTAFTADNGPAPTSRNPRFTTFRGDEDGQLLIFNLDTRPLAPGVQGYQIHLNDGSVIAFSFTLRSEDHQVDHQDGQKTDAPPGDGGDHSSDNTDH